MSILIKGMMMPKSCELCPFCEIVDSEVMGCVVKGCVVTHCLCLPRYGQGRPSWCPLVEIHPHGRLIDENDVMKSAEELRESPWYNDEPYHAMRKDGFEMAIDMAVKDAPTVIEAEGVKK